MKDPNKLSDLSLEKLHLGELDPSLAALYREPLNSAETQDRLKQLQNRDQDFFSRFSTHQMLTQIRVKAEKTSVANKTGLSFKSFRSLAVVASILIVSGVFLIQDQFSRNENRVKGLRSYLNVYRKMGDSVERLREKAGVRRGDLVQVSYVVPENLFGVIISVDGANHVTWHFPNRPGEAAALRGGSEVFLSNSFELDDSPKFERFLLITSADRFGEEAVHAFLKNNVSQPDLESYTITLKRE